MKTHRKVLIAVLSVLIILSWTLCARGQTTQPTQPSVWYQPPSSFAKWKARGIQVIYGLETEGVDGDAAVGAYMKAIEDNGLFCVLPVRAKAYWKHPRCIGVIVDPDEPDAKSERTDDFKKRSDGYRALTTKDRFITLNAGALLNLPDETIAAYCASAEKIGFFSYPYNFGLEAAGVLGEVGPALDKLHRLAPGKAIFFCGECGDQDMKNSSWRTTTRAASMHGPSGDQMAFEYGIALAHGANGLMYFPQKIGANWEAFDDTTPECEAVMKRLNALYTPTVITVIHDNPPPATQPATAPIQYGQVYVHMRTYDGGKTWRVVTP